MTWLFLELAGDGTIFCVDTKLKTIPGTLFCSFTAGIINLYRRSSFRLHPWYGHVPYKWALNWPVINWTYLSIWLDLVKHTHTYTTQPAPGYPYHKILIKPRMFHEKPFKYCHPQNYCRYNIIWLSLKTIPGCSFWVSSSESKVNRIAFISFAIHWLAVSLGFP